MSEKDEGLPVEDGSFRAARDHTPSDDGGDQCSLATENAALRAECAALTKALTGLTSNGSEFFVRRGDRYTADIAACVAWVRKARAGSHRRAMDATKDAAQLRQALKELAVFASLRATDPPRVFSKVARGALVTIAEKAKQAALAQQAEAPASAEGSPEAAPVVQPIRDDQHKQNPTSEGGA